MIGFIKRNLVGTRILLLFIATNLVYGFMLIVTIPKTMAFADGMKLLDMMPMGYDSAYVIDLMNKLGEDGRETYLYYQIPVDFIYPFLFGLCYSLLLAYFIKRLQRLDTALIYFCLLPILAGLADYLENFGIVYLLSTFPALPDWAIKITNIFSVVKSAATTGYFITLILVLIVLGVNFLIKVRNFKSN